MNLMLDWGNPYLVAVEMFFTALTLELLVSLFMKVT